MNAYDVCKIAKRVIKPHIDSDREILIAICKTGSIYNVRPGNKIIGSEHFVRGILFCPKGDFFGSVHNHPNRPDIPSFVDIYHYLKESLGGYMCIASRVTRKLSCYQVTKTFDVEDVLRLVNLVNKALAAYYKGDKNGFKKYVIKAKKLMMQHRICRISLD